MQHDHNYSDIPSPLHHLHPHRVPLMLRQPVVARADTARYADDERTAQYRGDEEGVERLGAGARPSVHLREDQVRLRFREKLRLAERVDHVLPDLDRLEGNRCALAELVQPRRLQIIEDGPAVQRLGDEVTGGGGAGE